MTFYARDLARIHDDGYGDHARAAAAALLELVGPPGLVVELGCGGGISSAILADAGFEVVGIDASDDTLAIARERVPAATFVRASAWDADIPPCAAVTAFGEVLNYTNAGSGGLARLCARVHASLGRGGVFLFDVATIGRGSATHQREGAGWRVDSATVEDADARTLVRRIRFTIGGRESEETHMLHLYTRDEVSGYLDAAGFATEILEGYGDLSFPAGYAGFLACKPDVS